MIINTSIGTIVWKQKIINLIYGGLKIPNKQKVLILHTGGTIGSTAYTSDNTENEPSLGPLKPSTQQEFEKLFDKLKTAHDFDIETKIVPCNPLLDSSRMEPENWEEIARLIAKNLIDGDYSGVVVTHGTDTLAYTAAGVSFLLPVISGIPIIFTASQVIFFLFFFIDLFVITQYKKIFLKKF